MADERKWKIGRRGFLVAGTLGFAAVGVPIALGRGRRALAAFVNGDEIANLAFGALPTDPLVWLEVHADDTVVVHSPKTEMGQGIHTALAQIAAAELGARWDQVRVVQASTASGFAAKNMDTGGSFSLRGFSTPLREAAAQLREAMAATGARVLGVTEVEVQGGRVRPRSGGEGVSFGEVVTRSGGVWTWPTTAPALRSRDEASAIVGRSIPRVDVREKLRGRATYGYDARVPGMLFGAIARPPRYHAELLSASEGGALQVPGVVRVVLKPGFAGVVARSRSAAHQGVSRLELTWSEGTRIDTATIESLVAADEAGVEVFAHGSASEPAEGERVIEAEFRTSMAAHSALEPQAALVDASGPVVRAWVSTQLPSMAVEAIAQAIEREPAEIEVIPQYLGGGFGRKSGHDVAAEAAILSQAAGAPVHVGFTRQEELQRDFYRPPTHHRLRAIVAADGAIRALTHRIASGDVALSFGANPLPGGELGASIIGFDPGTVISLPGPYAFESLHVTLRRVKLPVPTGSWRGLGAIPNTFALEGFLDDLAAALGRDPIDLRLAYLATTAEGDRLKRLLGLVREASRWDARLTDMRALGVACGAYHGTPIAVVAEVSGKEALKVETLWAAVDAGLIVNPDGARAQLEGGLLWGISAALKERVTVRDGMVEQDTLPKYAFATLHDTPRVELIFDGASDEPRGLGEVPLICVPSAIRAAARALGLASSNTMPRDR